jgi:hypothetical protein
LSSCCIIWRVAAGACPVFASCKNLYKKQDLHEEGVEKSRDTVPVKSWQKKELYKILTKHYPSRIHSVPGFFAAKDAKK